MLCFSPSHWYLLRWFNRHHPGYLLVRIFYISRSSQLIQHNGELGCIFITDQYSNDGHLLGMSMVARPIVTLVSKWFA